MQSKTIMQPYDELLSEILYHGETQFNKRTGSECKVIVGTQQKYDLRQGFPILTTRRVPIRSIIGELLGFFRGYTNAKDFRNLKCGFWDINANSTQSWLDNPMREGTDDLGRVYGSQWTDWEAVRLMPVSPKSNLTDQIAYLGKKKWHTETHVFSSNSNYPDGQYILATKRINQLEDVVKRVMTDPSDRRIVLTGWNPAGADFQALPACHMSYKFTPMQSGVMHVVMDMRSMDFYLGTPANIVSTALLLEIVCRLTGYTAGTVTIQGANTHLYENSYEAAAAILSRQHRLTPTLVLSENIKKLQSVEDIAGCFAKIEPADIELVNYYPDTVIPVAMMA